MLGVLIISAIISSFFFHDKRPKDRATFTVASAIAIQLILSVFFNIVMGSALAERGYETNFDLGEFFARWLLGAPITGLIVWAGLWWWYQRKWIDDDENAETFE